MASGTADLQRDLGGAIMHGRPSARCSQPATRPPFPAQIAAWTRASRRARPRRSKSFASAEAAQQHLQYLDVIIAGARQAFLDGDDWAYTAGVVSILLGAALVYLAFPKKAEEDVLLAAYHDEDTGVAAPRVTCPWEQRTWEPLVDG